MSTYLTDHVLDTEAMRDAYCKALIKEAHSNDRIIALETDVMNSMGTVPFAKTFPARSFNCGIMEANAIGVAAGLSATGFVPFFHAFGIFATRRCFDQIFVSGAYAGSTIKIIGGDSGVTAAYNGGTHMPFEDMGIMRCIPEVTIIEPADAEATRKLLPQIAKAKGIHYMRSSRKNVIKIYAPEQDFQIGQANLVRNGSDLTLIACGIMVAEALKAAEILAAQGIQARVADMFTIKPIDRNFILQAAAETGAIVTVENHNIFNGLGSAVCEVVAEAFPIPVERVGIKDRFGQVGSMEELMAEYDLTPEEIVKKSVLALKRKAAKEVNFENCSHK